MKKIIVFLACVLIFMLSPQYMNSANADVNTSDDNKEYLQELESYKDRDYIIKNYHVDIKITEDNVYKIKETIQAYFNVNKHGIIRNIPIKNELFRTDGTTDTVYAKIRNIDVNNEYSVSRSSESCDIKIGLEDETVRGNQTYIIEYVYDLGNDSSSKYDEVYFNIIGTGWDVAIENVTFNIKMPKDFETEKIGFSVGLNGTVGTSSENEMGSIKYQVNNNEINGKLIGFLEPYEGITIRTELPEGYFTKKDITEDKINYLIYIIPIGSFIIAFILWYIFGKDNKQEYKMEYYPPEGYNSLQVAYIYKGHVSNKDVVSLLVYLADKGYLRIEEMEKEKVFQKDTVKIIKLKEYDGNDFAERRFIDGLFSDSYKESYLYSVDSIVKAKNRALGNEEVEFESDNFVRNKEVKLSELKDKFYKVIEEIVDYTTCEDNRDLFFESNTKSKSVIVALLMILSTLSLTLIPTANVVGMEGARELLFILLFLTPFIIIGLAKGMGILFRIIWLGFIAMFLFITLGGYGLFDMLLYEEFYLKGWCIGIVCMIGMVICFKNMPKRTPLGVELYAKIKGFKKFLKESEKTRLEEMVNDNPTYFYNILPYTYVLGVSDKWIKKFQVIGMQAPLWYDGQDNYFSPTRFGRFMNNTMERANTSLTSSPSSGSGSGGGSSGGGSGGGGGSSW